MAKRLHEISHESHIHIGHHWYERPVFVGLCFAVIVAGCFFIGEHTSSKPIVASAADASVPAKNIVIATVGDSNTEGTGVPREEQAELSYPAQLQAMLGSHYEVSNFGVSGATLISGTNNPYPKHAFFKQSKELEADIVLIMLGTNDVRTQIWDPYKYKKQFIAFINEYKQTASSPKIYILTPPAMTRNDEFKKHFETETIPEIYAVATETDSTVIDAYTATKAHTELIPDGIHPNAEGYGIIAETVYKELMNY